MYSHAHEALTKINKVLKKKFADILVSMYAFGSRVRGNHTEDSDFDVLVIVTERTPAVESTIIDAFVEEEMRSGLSFDPVIKDIESFELEKRHHTPFYENIQREGILI